MRHNIPYYTAFCYDLQDQPILNQWRLPHRLPNHLSTIKQSTPSITTFTKNERGASTATSTDCRDQLSAIHFILQLTYSPCRTNQWVP